MFWYFVLLLVAYNCAEDVPFQCTDCSCVNPIVDCRQVGDVCDVIDNVIDCSFRKLQASFSAENSKWLLKTNATELNMEHNFIGVVVGFPALKIDSLILRYNTIIEIHEMAFIDLTKLVNLDLSYNDLSQLSPAVFQGHFSPAYYEPLNIASLNLSYNQLSELDQNLFEHLPGLTRLMLAGNPLADKNGGLSRNTVVAIAGSAPNLELLDLSETGISSLPPTLLKNLPDLKELVLMRNKFIRIPTHELSFANQLQILNLNFNPVTVISSADKFPAMPSLLQLHISHMHELKRIEGQALQGLSNLRYLSCYNNVQLESIADDALSTKNLSKLELNDNNLHYLPQKLVSDWKAVSRININGNGWSCDCRNQWMIDSLLPMLHDSKSLICSQPGPMEGKFMAHLAERKYQMRCLDSFGNHPENDGTYLVATFVITIIALVAIAGILLYRRGRFRRGHDIDYTAIYHNSAGRESY